MKSLVPTLPILAILAIAARAAAVDISDNDLKLGLVLNLQTRAEMARASDSNGDDYNIEANGAGKSDTADFYLRRFRPGFKGTYQNDWKFGAILNLDDSDRAGARTSATIHQGWIAREFASDSNTHTVKMGLDYAFFNTANAMNSVSLLPVQRASAALLPVRGAGISYFLNHPMVRWGVDIQNNTADSATPEVVSATQDQEAEGLCYTTRVEITGPGEHALPKWQETWAGKAGSGWIVGLEIGRNDGDRTVAAGVGETIDTTCWGIDVVGHWERLCGLLEYRAASREFSFDDGATTQDDLKQRTIIAQVGYGLPSAGGAILEPAIRYSIIDMDTDDDNEAVNYAGIAGGNKDYGSSGTELDLGVNWYFNAHANKLSLAYSLWEAEDGDADANIVRLQHQLNF